MYRRNRTSFCERACERRIQHHTCVKEWRKLDKESLYLRDAYGVDTLTVVKDFSECHRDPIEFFTDLYDQVKSKDISIVVNNVGKVIISHFEDQSFDEIENDELSQCVANRFHIPTDSSSNIS